MDTLRKSIGLGGASSTESGQEPISGESGRGTAAEPYDSGNLPEPEKGGEAPQKTSLPGEGAAAVNEGPTATAPGASSEISANRSAAAPNATGSVDELPEPKHGHARSVEMPGSKTAAPPVDKPDYGNAPLKPVEASSHGRRSSIPVAGGVPLGSVAGDAREERRRSVDARRKSRETGTSSDYARESIPEEKAPELPRQTAAQGSSSAATAASSIPPGEGEAGPAPTTEILEEPSPRTSVSEAKTTTAELVPPDATPDGKTSTATKVQDPPAPSTSPPEKSTSKDAGSPGSPGEDRRRSLFGKLKDKIKS